jgi:predicted nucleic acid-binding protein
MTEPTRGLLDTSVVVDHDIVDATLLPDQSAISAVTLVELAAGPHAAADGLPLYTRNPDDIIGLDEIVTVVRV